MALTSLQTQTINPTLKVLIYILLAVGLGVAIYFGIDIVKNIGNLRGKSALSVNVLNGSAKVLINGQEVGAAPYESDSLKSGDNKITVQSDYGKYEVALNFSPNTQVVLNRDLGTSEVFSSGQNFWIEKSDVGTILSVITEPSQATVYIDNTKVGETPYSLGTLSAGDYDMRLEFPGYEPQSARIKIQKDHKLNVSARLFPVPVPSKVSLLEGSSTLYDVYSESALVFSNPVAWAGAVAYWNKTRGVNLAGAGVNKNPVFGYFVSYDGGLFDANGAVATADTLKDTLSDSGVKGAFLRRAGDGAGLTEAAKTALADLQGVAGKKAKILETGTGWLRVRDAASLNGKEVGRVDVGKEYAILEEATGWVKIKVDDKISGWVSSTYAQVSK